MLNVFLTPYVYDLYIQKIYVLKNIYTYIVPIYPKIKISTLDIVIFPNFARNKKGIDKNSSINRMLILL